MRTIRPTPSGDAIDRELWSMLDEAAAAARRFHRDRLILLGFLVGGYLLAVLELLGSARPWVAFGLAFYAGPLGGLGLVALLDRTAARP